MLMRMRKDAAYWVPIDAEYLVAKRDAILCRELVGRGAHDEQSLANFVQDQSKPVASAALGQNLNKCKKNTRPGSVSHILH
jgi:hypothetical protein